METADCLWTVLLDIRISIKANPTIRCRVSFTTVSHSLRISNRSVALIPELYDILSYDEPIETIRKWFPEDVSFLS